MLFTHSLSIHPASTLANQSTPTVAPMSPNNHADRQLEITQNRLKAYQARE